MSGLKMSEKELKIYLKNARKISLSSSTTSKNAKVKMSNDKVKVEKISLIENEILLLIKNLVLLLI